MANKIAENQIRFVQQKKKKLELRTLRFAKNSLNGILKQSYRNKDTDSWDSCGSFFSIWFRVVVEDVVGAIFKQSRNIFFSKIIVYCLHSKPRNTGMAIIWETFHLWSFDIAPFHVYFWNVMEKAPKSDIHLKQLHIFEAIWR